MAGLDPAIHESAHPPTSRAEMDARIPGSSPGRSGHDGVGKRADRERSRHRPARRPPGGLGRAGRGRALRHHAPRGRGRARHQGGAGGGRLRPLLRPPRGRRVRLVRLAQPGQGIHRPRHQGRGRQRPAAPHRRQGRRVRAEPRARRGGTRGLRFGRAQAPASAPHHLRHQRLRRERPLRRDEGLRLPDPVRIGDRVGHRHA